MSPETTETIYVGLRNLHLGFGCVALATFWIQLAKRKGGSSHRRVGWLYLGAMIGVLTSALPMTVFLFLRGQEESAFFLGFLTLITFAAGLEAVLASRNRSSAAWLHGRAIKLTTFAIFSYSIGLLVLFSRTRFPLFLILALLGIAGTVEYFARARRDRPYRWVVEHINGVMATGIAVHIAFLSFGLRRFVDGEFTLWAFVVPLVAGQLMAVWFRRRFLGAPGRAPV